MLNLLPERSPAARGRIILFTGCMFSGKTTALLHRVMAARSQGAVVSLFAPAMDTRYGTTHVTSHDGLRVACSRVASSAEILGRPADVVGIDEAQFFSDGLPDVVAQLAAGGAMVLVASLDLDFLAQPFGPAPELARLADEVVRLEAACAICAAPATRTFRKTRNSAPILLGAADHYEPRCLRCYSLP